MTGQNDSTEAAQPIPMQGGRLRPVNHADLDELRAFFATPAVNEHWGGEPLDDAEILAKYTGQRSPQVECFIVEESGECRGLVQYHLADEAPDSGGIDLVLVPSARGSGLGTSVVHALVDFLQGELGWKRITVDPDVSNLRGVNFWNVVGFEQVRLVESDPTREPFWLMSRPTGG